MVRCKDCRFWKVDPDPYIYFDEPREPHADFGQCSIFLSTDGTPKHKDTLAYALDHESYAATVLTSPEFGCVQGQHKK